MSSVSSSPDVQEALGLGEAASPISALLPPNPATFEPAASDGLLSFPPEAWGAPYRQKRTITLLHFSILLVKR